MSYSRRDFGKVVLGGIPIATAALTGSNLLAEAASQAGQTSGVLNSRGAGCLSGDFGSNFAGVQIGVITWYSYRQMPSLTIPSLLSYLVENGINGCELECGAAEPFAGAPGGALSGFFGRGRGGGRRAGPPTAAQRAAMRAAAEKRTKALNQWRMSVPMTKFEQIRRMYADRGIKIYGYKLEPVEASFPDAVFDYAFNAAKALGADQLTMEMPTLGGSIMNHSVKTDNALTKRIGAIAAKHRIMVGYHAHLDATPTFWDTAMSQSKYNGINLDVGHYVAAGNRDTIAFVKKNHDRITSIHLKDRDYPQHNHGSNEPWGQGDTPLKGLLQLMRDEKYRFPGSVELEYAIPAGSNPVIEVGRCVSWAKNVLLANGPGIAVTA